MKTLLYQLPESVKFMMSYVIVTSENNVIVIDGGRPEDMPLLKEVIKKRKIKMWILTHPHNDHINGFVTEAEENGLSDFDIEKIAYNFPPYEIINNRNVKDYEYYQKELNEILPRFNKIEPLIKKKALKVKKGDTVQIDEVKIDFIYSYHKELTDNLMNDASLVFKVTTPKKTVLFLGDLGPQGGDVLMAESKDLLKADIVQMAHHGHMNVSMEVYAEIQPEACLWCCNEALYNEEAIPFYLRDTEKLLKQGRCGMYGTLITRKWMDILGVKTHYVAKDGIIKIEI